MNTFKLLPLLLGMSSTIAMATTCTTFHLKPNEVVTVKSAQLLGTRLQLPANLISAPINSNQNLWDVEGVVGTNQLLIKPNSAQRAGAEAMVHAYTSDGKVYDIKALRVREKSNETCVVVNPGNQAFTKKVAGQLQSFVSQQQVNVGDQSGEIAQLRQQLTTVERTAHDNANKAVVAALQKYRYHIYTRYQWNEGKAFVGNNTISDVYDDGRFTYIRLANPNRGVLSVETEIGGKNAIAPVKYDDNYGIYRITGIYSHFTLRMDDVKIEVARSDNGTQGAA